MPLLFIAMQNSKTPLGIAERGFLRCLAERFDRNYCKTLSREGILCIRPGVYFRGGRQDCK